ncbi:hypothetical protein DM02DRAFT_583712 [Periconia macrospinosa]|uniref:Heme oxygenase-like protein n=1 Tax=Periconia macrospinosa TaxID=97972 RepID=A0A2V1E502_9PLEO|nr:hypothetical protein DM02DRAFT_583712 [Periconia macrospinosa]
MFILQTTIAILIAFLALTAYNKLRSRISKGKSKQKDLEAPGSLKINSENKVNSNEKAWREPDLSELSVETCKEMDRHKLLYYKLHNLENHPEIIPRCHDLLVSLLATTLADAFKDESDTILSIAEFSRDKLTEFLLTKDSKCTDNYEAYIARRRAGGNREIFSTEQEAKWWLKQAAPVKYVDGAWLGHINKISTTFKHGRVTKNAWQVMSEELGDGDLEKNHVYVYRELMKEIDAGLPEPDSKDFIHPRHGLNEPRCWKAAMAQLLISLFPHDFLPEALGFNMAYESLPLHLLKTVRELRELRLNPYYFELHISIDNGSSGHAAMAMETVIDYIESVRKDGGEEAAHIAWKRVQAGFVLAEGLPTTPESPSMKKKPCQEPFPRNEIEARVIEVFAAKAPVAHKIHCNSRLKIGRRSLVDWLEPNAFRNPQWQKDFLDDLSNCKPWVIKGSSQKSRLVKEMSWEGKMFGSFMQSEVETLKEWIDSLDKPTNRPIVDPMIYFNFVAKSPTIPQTSCILKDYPSFARPPCNILQNWETAKGAATPGTGTTFLHNSTEELNLSRFLPLWFASRALLESLPSVPVRAADPFGSAIVRILRAQTGFSNEGPGVAGMDEVRRTWDGKAVGIIELGLEMYARAAGLTLPLSLEHVMDAGHPDSASFAIDMLGISMHWLEYRDLLVGMTCAVMEMHFWVVESDEGRLLGQEGKGILRGIAERERKGILRGIAERERKGLEVCRREIERDEERRRMFAMGMRFMQDAISKCFAPR